MKPRISVLTIGVNDLKKSLRFYRDGLGLKTEGIVGEEYEYGAVVFFDLQHSIKLALYPRKNLARDVGIKETLASATELSIGHNVNSKKEVDAVMARAKKAGAQARVPATGLPIFPPLNLSKEWCMKRRRDGSSTRCQNASLARLALRQSSNPPEPPTVRKCLHRAFPIQRVTRQALVVRLL
ncbi:MAG: VOC family protein [Candidatus Taylorbacteria bacterium]|nr:VOC family protein [Candidatus Taylorbacteria bacterium]